MVYSVTSPPQGPVCQQVTDTDTLTANPRRAEDDWSIETEWQTELEPLHPWWIATQTHRISAMHLHRNVVRLLLKREGQKLSSGETGNPSPFSTDELWELRCKSSSVETVKEGRVPCTVLQVVPSRKQLDSVSFQCFQLVFSHSIFHFYKWFSSPFVLLLVSSDF